MKTIFLRFPSEQAYTAALAPFTNEEGNVTLPDWDVLGVITRGGQWDEDGNVIVEPEVLDGYHVNAFDVPEELEQYVISSPNQPYRIFSGDVEL